MLKAWRILGEQPVLSACWKSKIWILMSAKKGGGSYGWMLCLGPCISASHSQVIGPPQLTTPGSDVYHSIPDPSKLTIKIHHQCPSIRSDSRGNARIGTEAHLIEMWLSAHWLGVTQLFGINKLLNNPSFLNWFSLTDCEVFNILVTVRCV